MADNGTRFSPLQPGLDPRDQQSLGIQPPPPPENSNILIAALNDFVHHAIVIEWVEIDCTI